MRMCCVGCTSHSIHDSIKREKQDEYITIIQLVTAAQRLENVSQRMNMRMNSKLSPFPQPNAIATQYIYVMSYASRGTTLVLQPFEPPSFIEVTQVDSAVWVHKNNLVLESLGLCDPKLLGTLSTHYKYPRFVLWVQ